MGGRAPARAVQTSKPHQSTSQIEYLEKEEDAGDSMHISFAVLGGIRHISIVDDCLQAGTATFPKLE